MEDGDGNGICFPYDVLLDILRRLPGGAIAACQCVCRSWRDIIDGHKLSLERYFPRRAFPAGLFVSKIGCRSSCTFFAPSRRRRLYYPRKTEVRHSCNGLLLMADWDGYYVLNPATARCTHLPSLTPWSMDLMSLAFDPAVSLHYHVFLFQKDILLQQSSLARPMGEEDQMLKEKVVPLLVYSSCTGHWENQVFAPGRCAPGHLYDMVARPPAVDYEESFWLSEYWRGSLYVQCHNNVLMILHPSNSKGTYDMVLLPCANCGPKSTYSLRRNSLLASYERGIHFVVIHHLQLRVWLLTESADAQLGWTLVHDASLYPHGHMVHPLTIQPRVKWRTVGSKSGPVSLTDDDDYDSDEEEDDLDGSECSWNSDEENFIDVVEATAHLGPPAWGHYGRVVGFHPHRNAVILVLYFAVVVYHLDTARMQYLGSEHDIMKDNEQQACCVDDMFTYRPCYEDVLQVGKSSMSSWKVECSVIHDT